MVCHHYPQLHSVEAVKERFDEAGYICTQQIATVIYLASALNKPVLIEGPPGVGKTELAKTCATVVAKPLVRLQCYEGLDEAKALYEWKYGKQLLYTQILKERLGVLLEGADTLQASLARLHASGDAFYAREFLEPRPLLKALEQPDGAVLLIDEIDKSDTEFESLLLEVLSDFQVSIPELGTVSAQSKPLVFLTSNDTRELSDALKRRCLHLHIDFPSIDLERQILAQRVPELQQALTDKLVRFVHSVRSLDLKKTPAVSETLDWARSLILLHATDLDENTVRQTLNVLLKYEEDIQTTDSQIHSLLRTLESV